ncbi:phage tail assembly protein [Ancylobacter sp. SL191]|uniref:phage tail assembly protein n=1 Tax=Ancylobacter sp. SL191 TaxID=2995166 RepID=UPI0022721D30|nr:phage tail assembly protein [Ancylobacter sp. SL191]WAC26266.1 phage tail assembly protein [Ancylobacter sp. SL191]
MDMVTRSLTAAEVELINAGQLVGVATSTTAPAAPSSRLNGPVTLEFPVEHEGRSYTAIDVSNPAMGVVEEVQEAAATMEPLKLSFLMISRFAEVPPEVVRKLRRSDYERVLESISPLSETPASGGQPASSGPGLNSPAGAPTSPTQPTS